MDRTLDSVGNEYRLYTVGYLNGWIGYRTKAGITGAFGVKERMIMIEEWWSFAKKRDFV